MDKRKKKAVNKKAVKKKINTNTEQKKYANIEQRQRKPAPPENKPKAKKYVSKKRIKQRNRFIAVFSLILILVITFTTLSLTVFFPIKTINVVNSKKYSENDIISAIGVVKGDNLLLASESRANSAVKENYPYIESIEFAKKLPFTLNVNVNEYSVYAQIKYGGAYLRIAKDSTILESTDKYYKKAPVICGVKVKQKKIGEIISFDEDNKEESILEKVEEITTSFESNKLKGITLINFENMQDIRVTYNNKIVMLLGSSSNLSKKLTHAKATLEARGDTGESGTLNLSRIPSAKNEASFIPRELEDTEIAGK